MLLSANYWGGSHVCMTCMQKLCTDVFFSIQIVIWRADKNDMYNVSLGLAKVTS